MKLNRTYLFIAVTSLALMIVLIIQVNWILQTATIKEELFNEKANLVLSKTAEILSTDTAAFRKMEIHVDRNDVSKIDSLFSHYMKFYNIHIDYVFEINPGPIATKSETRWSNRFYQDRPGSYNMCIDEGDSNKGLELKLIFPDKKQFILAEMGIPFITSIVLILAVLILSWRTILSLLKEKKIAEHTTDFLNNMTHEFKTPLTNIALAGKMILKDPAIKQKNKAYHYSEIILEENEKLKQQVEQMLSMTALERGEIPLQKTELDVHQLIQEALRSIHIQIENKQGVVKLLLEAHHFVIMGDPPHLTNTFRNLLDNAIKYSVEKPQLSVKTSNNHQQLIVVLTDKGIGIAKEHQKNVFNKFFRVSTGNVHNVKGFGLGLAYVKKIIELHGGSIMLQSEKGKGTTFTITLPYV